MTRMQEIVTPDERQWDDYVQQQPHVHFFELHAWAVLKQSDSWDSFRQLAVVEHNRIIAGAQIVFRRLPFRLGKVAYVAMDMDASDTASRILWDAIDQAAQDNGARFLKWEPGILFDEEQLDFAALGFRKSPQHIQPAATILIDISGDDDTILKRMNQGTRRKIRQSSKKGINYDEGTRADMQKFIDIMQETGTRQEIDIFSPAYYQRAYDLLVPDHAALILAEHEGDVLAGVVVVAAGQNAWYLYGASSNIKRSLMAAYGVQWQAIQWAKARGCTRYDMWGIPNADKETLEAEFEGKWGIYGFKRGWGGEIVYSPGAWDKVYDPLVYRAYLLALKAQKLTRT